jgi:hypothetical protein
MTSTTAVSPALYLVQRFCDYRERGQDEDALRLLSEDCIMINYQPSVALQGKKAARILLADEHRFLRLRRQWGPLRQMGEGIVERDGRCKREMNFPHLNIFWLYVKESFVIEDGKIKCCARVVMPNGITV